MKMLLRSFAIVAGLMMVALIMPAKAQAGYSGYYGGGCCYYAPARIHPYPYYYHRPRHKVVIVIILKKHHRHHYAHYVRPYMNYGYAYRY